MRGHSEWVVPYSAQTLRQASGKVGLSLQIPVWNVIPTLSSHPIPAFFTANARLLHTLKFKTLHLMLLPKANQMASKIPGFRSTRVEIHVACFKNHCWTLTARSMLRVLLDLFSFSPFTPGSLPSKASSFTWTRGQLSNTRMGLLAGSRAHWITKPRPAHGSLRVLSWFQRLKPCAQR